MKRKIKWTYLVLGILILAAQGITLYRNLAYHYELRGDVTDLSGYELQAYGYDIVDAGGGTGRSFAVTGGDPQFILAFVPENAGAGGVKRIGGIALEFDSAWSGANPLPVQIFYARTGENFSERHSAKSVLKTGEKTLLVPIPAGEYQTLRFDIDGDFVLAGLQSCDAPMGAEAYVSQETVHKCLWYFPAIIVGFCLVFWAHGVRRRAGGFTGTGYVRYVFLGANPTPEREVYLDYLRILAAVFVILAHSCSPMVDLADAAWKRLVLVCGLSLGLCCNLLYVMLSGSLLLRGRNGKEEGVLSFYIRRASKVIIPLAAYYLLLLSLNNEVHFLPPENLGAAFRRIVTGAPDVGPHLWLIYTIVALYLVTPFFRVMVQHMSDRLLLSLAVVILALNTLTTYLPLFGMTFGAATFLAGWEGVFLLGYILTRRSASVGKAKMRGFLLAAMVSYIVMVAVVFADSARMNYVYNSTPPILLASCGIFFLFLQYKDCFKGKSNALVRLCSKYSYSIILIHWYALFVVVQGKFHVTALRFGCLGGIAVCVVLTFLVCIGMAVVFDNTVVIVCNVIFDKLTARLVNKEYE